jgi:hypothetical protein
LKEEELLGRIVADDESICEEFVRLGSEVERCRLLVIDVDKSS